MSRLHTINILHISNRSKKRSLYLPKTHKIKFLLFGIVTIIITSSLVGYKIHSETQDVDAYGLSSVLYGDLIAQTATELAWHDNSHHNFIKPEFATAASEVGLHLYGVNLSDAQDCGKFVSVVIRKSGADNSFPEGGTPYIENYLQQSSSWEEINNNGLESNLLPGDVFVVNGASGGWGVDGHTFIYIGNSKIASASLDDYTGKTTGNGGLIFSDSRGKYRIFRSTKKAYDKVSFEDISLCNAIDDDLGRYPRHHPGIINRCDDPTPSLLIDDYKAITDIRLGNSSYDFSNLNGIEVFSNLTYLAITNKSISDVSPLAQLHNLTYLHLNNDLISDITPLGGLTNLRELYLHKNLISDITPLGELVNLERLGLGENQISDITPLGGLTNLTDLNMYYNNISDISPLAYLFNLKELELPINNISDIRPLSGLINLEQLLLSSNKISDITPLRELINLKKLTIGNNQISDITPLFGLTNLQEIDLEKSKLSAYSFSLLLTNLDSLISLNLSNNNISDLSAIFGLYAQTPYLNNGRTATHLLSTNTYNSRNLTDKSSSNIIKLKQLNLSHNNISDIDILNKFDFPNLEELYLDDNKITNVPAFLFERMEKLRSLGMSHNQIAEFDFSQGVWWNNISFVDFSYQEVTRKVSDIIQVIPNMYRLASDPDHYIGSVSEFVANTFAGELELEPVDGQNSFINDKMYGYKKYVYIQDLFNDDGTILKATIKINGGAANGSKVSFIIEDPMEMEKIQFKDPTLCSTIAKRFENNTWRWDESVSDSFVDNRQGAFLDGRIIEFSNHCDSSSPYMMMMEEDIAAVTSLNIQPTKKITSLDGINAFTNLERLDIGWNSQISDLSPLSDLTNLRYLYLSGNQISDLSPLSNLRHLETMLLNNNQISDLSPLSDLISLRYLYLSGNQISDLSPLSNLNHLICLELSDNQISDVSPLANLISLDYLNVNNNSIDNFEPLSQLDLRILLDENNKNNKEHKKNSQVVTMTSTSRKFSVPLVMQSVSLDSTVESDNASFDSNYIEGEIIDSSKPATINIHGGVLDNSTITVLYEGDEEPEDKPSGEVTYPNGQEFSKEGEDHLIISIDYPAELFSQLLLDNNELDTTKYNIESGSTIITIYSEYLNTLDAGNHEVRVVYTDGTSIDANFTMAQQDINSDPGTEQDSSPEPNQEKDDSAVPVPNTSTDGTTPNTGANTDVNAGNISVDILIIAPMVLPLIGYLLYRKKKNHYKYDF